MINIYGAGNWRLAAGSWQIQKQLATGGWLLAYPELRTFLTSH